MAAFGSVRTIIEKMSNDDPDYRYMATSDLLEQLAQPGHRQYDSDTQRRLCSAVITLLTDTSSEVQGMAQRCLPPLARFVDDRHAVFLVKSLLDHVVAPQNAASASQSGADSAAKSMRDVASLGLKSIINGMPMSSTSGPSAAKPSAALAPHALGSGVVSRASHTAAGESAAAACAEHMIPRLLAAISAPIDPKSHGDIQIDSLELLTALLSRLAPILASSHQQIRDAVLPQLGAPRPVVSKRATTCLAVLAPVCSHAVLASIVDAILVELRAAGPTKPRARTRAAVHAIWAVSKTAGRRLAPTLPALVPIILAFCRDPFYADDDELREHCLQTLQSFVELCTREMAEHSDNLVALVVSLSKYDPNYDASDDDDDEGMSSAEDDGGNGEQSDQYDDEDDDDYSDDEDISWKVRRAAIKCIHATIAARLRPIDQLYADYGQVLVSRFREREEAVKLDVFTAFSALLRQGSLSAPDSSPSSASSKTNVFGGDPMTIDNSRSFGSSVTQPIPFLQISCTKIVRAVKKELGSRSVKTRASAMSLLRELVVLSPTTVAPFIPNVIPEVQRSLSDPSAQMKTEALLFLRAVLDSCGAGVLSNHAQFIVPRILDTAEDKYYKITAESLRLCSTLVSAFGRASSDQKEVIAAMTPAIHDAALRRLTAQDQDSEVKEAGLTCVGATVALYGESLGAHRLSAVGPALCERLLNEVTRLAAVRALTRISVSENASALTPVIEVVTCTVGGFLRKSNPSLRRASLDFLSSAPSLSPNNDSMLLTNVCDLIVETDLRLASLALRLVARLIRTRGPSICALLANECGVYQNILNLSVSHLLQGRAVASLLDAYRSLAEVNAAPLDVECMLTGLRVKAMEGMQSSLSGGTARISGSGVLTPTQCVAKCVAEVCVGSPREQWAAAINGFVSEVAATSVQPRTFALACLGELGRRSLLGSGSSVVGIDETRAAILLAMDAAQEEVKTAAAVALGGIASGDGASGIPGLVDLLRRRPENRYLLLLSLRDAIAYSDHSDVSSFSSLLLEVLMEDKSEHQRSREEAEGCDGAFGVSAASPAISSSSATRGSGQESVRIATAECLGLVAQVNPEMVFPALKLSLASGSPILRSSVVSAIKFVVAMGPSELVPSENVDAHLRKHISYFLALANDTDVTVRKSAIQTINAIARVHPALMVPHFESVLSNVYKATMKNADLVRMVDLGPFKYEEDFGLDLRKSAYDTMRTMISGSLAPHIPLLPFLENIVGGLGDVPDVRAIAQLILGAVTVLPSAPHAVLEVLAKIILALEETLGERLKDNAVRQEKERHEDSQRGALRAVHVLEKMPDVASTSMFKSFFERVIQTEKLSDKYSALLAASGEMPSGVSAVCSDGDSTMRE
jgi:cullin-associated NEDD8-dissociated protein 1